MTRRDEHGLDRRTFLTRASMIVPAVLASPSLLSCASAPAHAARKPGASARKPRIAIIGCGGRGAENLGDLLGAGAEMAALCDVSRSSLDAGVARVAQASPGAAPRTFTDLRELFARRGELALDGVLVSTPDHTHAVATALALRAGLAAYCEKPLTHTLAESRRLLELARAARVPTQMGTQIHATENYRRVVELIRAGAIGRVTSCDCWVNKGWCCGPTGPVAAPPDGFDYDLWLGPAQNAPYIANLHPANWRKYWAYGTGTLGDMGCHMMDLPVWALGLDRARLGTVEIFATTDSVDSVACPEWTEASWAIPQRDAGGKAIDPLILRWFDNGRISPTAQELGAKDKVDYHGRFNMVFQGTKGWLWANYGEFLITPGALAAEVAEATAKAPPERIPASPGHHREWIDAIQRWRSGDPTAADAPLCAFERSTVLNEVVLGGTVAGRAGRQVSYDFQAQAFVGGDPVGFWEPEPRTGWSLDDRNLDRILVGRA
ncbi:MAG: Gfo/Idh/MocA family protein [bacterium]